MLRILFHALIGLMITGCTAAGQTGSATRSKDPQSVLSKTWQWEATVTPVEEITVPTPERYTIALMPDGKVQALLDCNRGSGSYEISGGRLSFGALLSTRTVCPADSLDGPFMRDLQRRCSCFTDELLPAQP
ncbi:MAG: META domain-containing protein [Acidiferrobacterales bacterium]|nr:META domain-containing protein [Acidiferrobacterales bacterium]